MYEVSNQVNCTENPAKVYIHLHELFCYTKHNIKIHVIKMFYHFQKH